MKEIYFQVSKSTQFTICYNLLIESVQNISIPLILASTLYTILQIYKVFSKISSQKNVSIDIDIDMHVLS